MKNFNQMKAGFTIIEMLVAITVLVVGVLGPLNLAARGISDGIFAKNQVAATFLAQEAMEVVVNTRNSNLLLHGKWLTGISNNTDVSDSSAYSEADCFDSTKPCYVDSWSNDLFPNLPTNPDTGLLKQASNVNDTNLNLQFCADSAVNHYVIGSSGCAPRTGPVFTRKVEITTVLSGPPNVNTTEIKVVVTVSWFDKALPKSFMLEQRLFKLNG